MIRKFPFALMIIINSCFPHSDNHREDGKIFHATAAAGGIGQIYFGLYKDKTYQICESGGIAQECYEGTYTLNKDTITLTGLKNESYLTYNRLVICRYKNQDSSYWKWKYHRKNLNWEFMRQQDLMMGNEGDVHQLDHQNRLVFDPAYHFNIKLDSLNEYK